MLRVPSHRDHTGEKRYTDWSGRTARESERLDVGQRESSRADTDKFLVGSVVQGHRPGENPHVLTSGASSMGIPGLAFLLDQCCECMPTQSLIISLVSSGRSSYAVRLSANWARILQPRNHGRWKDPHLMTNPLTSVLPPMPEGGTSWANKRL